MPPAADCSAAGTTSLNTRAPSEPPSTSSRIRSLGGSVAGLRPARRSPAAPDCRSPRCAHLAGTRSCRGETQRQHVGAAPRGTGWPGPARRSARAGSRRAGGAAAAAPSTGATRGIAAEPDHARRRPIRARMPRACTMPDGQRHDRLARHARRRARQCRRRAARIARARRTPRCVRPPERASVISAMRWPRATSSAASASAGKKCPPVPPAAMTIGLHRRPSHGSSSRPRRRVSASSMPMPSATASTDDPP